jgi:hypothetical protein
MKSIAEQNVAELGGSGSVLSRQRRDHIKLDHLLRRLAGTPVSDQGAVLLDIYRLVFPHAFAEEAVLWPVIRRVLPDGEQLTLQVEEEHQEINELVVKLEALDPHSPERQPLLDRIVALLKQDVRDEEDKLLAGLQPRLSTRQLGRLGLAWDTVRRIAPTRAHPIVARRPPGNALSALPLSLIDRIRDGVDAVRHRRAAAGVAPVFAALSKGLAGAARGVESLPGMRSGESLTTRVSPRSVAPRSVAVIAGVGALSLLAVLAKRRVLAR